MFSLLAIATPKALAKLNAWDGWLRFVSFVQRREAPAADQAGAFSGPSEAISIPWARTPHLGLEFFVEPF